MGKGLSPLQKDILAALEAWPSLEEQPVRDGAYDLSTWARPRDLIRELGRRDTAAMRTTISKALARLCQCGAVAAAESTPDRVQMRDPFSPGSHDLSTSQNGHNVVALRPK